MSIDKTYIAWLRGINVSGKNKLPMAALRESLKDSLGFVHLETYIQSGNLLFQTADSQPSETLADWIAQQIVKDFSLQVPVLVLQVEQLKSMLAGNPFLRNDSSIDEKQLHVTYLKEKPSSGLLEAVLTLSYPPDLLQAGNDVLYLLTPKGYGHTKFHNGFLEKKLGVSCTTRNWKTSKKMLNMAERLLS